MSSTAAMILCAGFGKRLGKLTENCPKPMLKIGEFPLVYYSLQILKKAGIKNVFINLHYLPEQIKDYLGDGSDFGLDIFYSYEKEPLGTAGALTNIWDRLTRYDNLLCLYGDIFTNQDLSELMDFHSKSNADLTFLTHEREKSNSMVLADESGKVLKFLERPSEEEIAESKIESPYEVNSAIYCMKSSLLHEFKNQFPLDFPKDVFPKVLAKEKLYRLPLKAFRVAVDSEDRLELARESLRRAGDFWKIK